MTPPPNYPVGLKERVSDAMLTEMRDRFRKSYRPDKRQYAEIFDELLALRRALDREALEALSQAAWLLENMPDSVRTALHIQRPPRNKWTDRDFATRLRQLAEMAGENT